jgi:putative heme-binding domain-containing protein
MQRPARIVDALARAVLFAALFTISSRIVAQGVQPAASYTQADITYGAQLYAAQCATCHGQNGDQVGGINLKSGTFRSVATDQDLVRVVTNGIPGAGMPAFRLDPSEVAGIVAYVRNMNTFDPGTVTPGDAARGKLIFDGRGDCTRCHRVGTLGSRAGPDLSDIGAARSAGSLQRSLVDPTSQMFPINRPVRVVTKDGTTVNGRRLNEDTYTVQLIDERGRLVSVAKADLREYAVGTVSPMPSYKTLAPGELADLVAYLLTLKGR